MCRCCSTRCSPRLDLDTGILSSAGELRYRVQSDEPSRAGFDLSRIMRARYKSDSYQATYLVVNSFQELFDARAPDFTSIYKRVGGLSAIDAGVVLDTERIRQR